MPGLGIRNRTIQSFSVEAALSSIWILSTGLWVDSSTWIDTAVWQDGTTPISFAALPSLPVSRRDAVVAAAGVTAQALSITSQAVLDAAGRCLEWWDWRSNVFTDAAASVPASQGNNVQTFRGVRAGLLSSQATESVKPVLGANGLVCTSDVLVAPATGFPTGDASLGVIAVVDFAATQPGGSTSPVPFARAAGNDATRILAYSSTDRLLASAGLNNVFFPSTLSPLGRTVGLFAFYKPSPREVTLRSDNTAEATVSVTNAPNFSGSVNIGALPGVPALASNCTIKQLAFTTSLTDARIMYVFLRQLEGI